MKEDAAYILLEVVLSRNMILFYVRSNGIFEGKATTDAALMANASTVMQS
jgi:hypothetical protein